MKCGSRERKKMGIWTKCRIWKKIIVFEMKCGSSNKKKSWVKSEDIKNCYEVWKLGKKKDGYLNEV